MSVTNEVFRHPRAPTWYWIYYTITKPDEFQKAENYSTSRPVVLMFSADWNEACKVMKMPFRAMALAKKKEAAFCLVDIDKLKKDSTIVANYRVEALPTFVLLKNRQETLRVVGAKTEEFNNMGAKI